MPYWGPEEGVALAFGLDPLRVVEDRPYDNPRLRAPDPTQHFAGLAQRAVARGDLEEEAQPSVFLDWAEGAGLAFHDNEHRHSIPVSRSVRTARWKQWGRS